MYLHFAELGLEKERMLYTRVGISMYDLNLLIHNPSEYMSNANLMRNPETIAKLVHDQVGELICKSAFDTMKVERAVKRGIMRADNPVTRKLTSKEIGYLTWFLVLQMVW